MWKQLITPLRFSPGPGYDSVFTDSSKSSKPATNGTTVFANGLSQTVSCTTQTLRREVWKEWKFFFSVRLLWDSPGNIYLCIYFALLVIGVASFIKSELLSDQSPHWRLNSVVASCLESPCLSTWLHTCMFASREPRQSGQNDGWCLERYDCERRIICLALQIRWF